MGGNFKREGTDVHLWLICIVVWQKSTQHCKAIILKKKKTQKTKRTINNECHIGLGWERGKDEYEIYF